VPSAQSLGGIGSEGGGFLSVLAPSPSVGLVSPPASQNDIPKTLVGLVSPPSMVNPTASMASYMANPTASMASYNPTASMGSMSPGKRFTFAAQEVMVAPPEPSATQEDLPRPPASMTTSQVPLRPLPDDQVRSHWLSQMSQTSLASDLNNR